MINLVRAELLKIRTTNTWWLFGLATVVTTALALLNNCFEAHIRLQPFDTYLQDMGASRDELPPAELARLHADWLAQHDVVGQAANIYTSGQFFGVLFVSLIAILLITNEYHHQTVTTTFLTTPRRTLVIIGKFGAGMILAALFWLATTAISLATGTVFLNAEGYGHQLDAWPVQRATLLNLAVYAVWVVFGIGFGALIRSQLGATITATVLYLLGLPLAQVVFHLIHHFMIKEDWVLTAQVAVPAIASMVMVSESAPFPESPPYWVGAAVLLGYGLVTGLVGTWILRRRDVS